MNRTKKVLIRVVCIIPLIIFIEIGMKISLKETILMQEECTMNPQNPARGYYVQIDSSDIDRLEQYQDDIRLCLLAYDIYEFRNEEISADKLKELEVFLQEARRRNIKCIFRAAYGFEEKKINDAESKELIEKHVTQIADIINAHKEEIYCVQAGFFGPWGEWHSSIYLEDDEEAKTNRNWLLDILLSNFDKELVIDVRRPRFLRDAWEARLDKNRLGIHNDGLLASDSDLGTYDAEGYSRESELKWLSEHLQTVCNGGEMPQISTYTESNNVKKEFAQMKLSYLNLKYNEEVYEQWKTEKMEGMDAYSYLSRRLGYRYYVSEVTYPKYWYQDVRGVFQNFEVKIVNEGFAPIDSRYLWEWVIEDTNGEQYFRKMEKISTKGQEEGFMINLKEIQAITVKRIGIRISEKSDKKKESHNCVEFVNRDNNFEDGVNYFWEKK